jgi:hypothetical protein
VIPLKIKIPSKNMSEKSNECNNYLFSLLVMSIHNILLTAPQLSISQKALETLPEDGNVMPKHVGATIYN